MKAFAAVIGGLLVLPLTLVMVILGGIILGVCWAFGVPLTLKRGTQEHTYRWFTRIN